MPFDDYREPAKRDSYRHLAHIYNLLEPFNRGLRLRGFAMFQPQGRMKVLDFGCGTGTQLELYGRYGCRLFGVDSSPAMLRKARERLGEAADLRLIGGDEIPFAAESFDLITCMLALHEMEEDERTAIVPEMKRVLQQNGRILWIDYHAGAARSLKGQTARLLCRMIEVAAGRRHYRNFRKFIAHGGLPSLIEANCLTVEKAQVVRSGMFALYLLMKSPPDRQERGLDDLCWRTGVIGSV